MSTLTENRTPAEKPDLFADEILYEVVDGEHKEKERMGAFESLLTSVLTIRLGQFVWQHRLGIVASETLFVLDADRPLRRRPDVAFVSYDRWPESTVPRSNAWNVVPDLAVEVVSSQNLAEEIDEKITEYFHAGVRLVWILYPASGRLYVYESPTQVHGLEKSGTLDGGEVLPGFQLSLTELFQAVTKPPKSE